MDWEITMIWFTNSFRWPVLLKTKIDAPASSNTFTVSKCPYTAANISALSKWELTNRMKWNMFRKMANYVAPLSRIFGLNKCCNSSWMKVSKSHSMHTSMTWLCRFKEAWYFTRSSTISLSPLDAATIKAVLSQDASQVKVMNSFKRQRYLFCLLSVPFLEAPGIDISIIFQKKFSHLQVSHPTSNYQQGTI